MKENNLEMETTMNKGLVEPEKVHMMMEITEIEGDEQHRWYLSGLCGPEVLFTRFGEFLTCMLEDDTFFFSKKDNDGVSTCCVKLEPYEDEEQTAEVDKKDLGEGTVVVDTDEN